jgi:hypothetical protein
MDPKVEQALENYAAALQDADVAKDQFAAKCTTNGVMRAEWYYARDIYTTAHNRLCAASNALDAALRRARDNETVKQ